MKDSNAPWINLFIKQGNELIHQLSHVLWYTNLFYDDCVYHNYVKCARRQERVLLWQWKYEDCARTYRRMKKIPAVFRFQFALLATTFHVRLEDSGQPKKGVFCRLMAEVAVQYYASQPLRMGVYKKRKAPRDEVTLIPLWYRDFHSAWKSTLAVGLNSRKFSRRIPPATRDVWGTRFPVSRDTRASGHGETVWTTISKS